MRSTLVAVIVTALILVGTAAVDAHHSYIDFDQNRTVSIEGTIEQIVFANPHVVLKVRADNSTVYTVTWSAARQLTSQGVAREALKAGDRVIISGNPSRKVPELSRIRDVSRTTDGWRWHQESGRVSLRLH